MFLIQKMKREQSESEEEAEDYESEESEQEVRDKKSRKKLAQNKPLKRQKLFERRNKFIDDEASVSDEDEVELKGKKRED